MKRISTLTKLFAVLGIAPIVAFTAAPVFATNQGQINGGNIYSIENKTQNTAYADPASANACDLLKYSVEIYNPGPAEVDNVMVSATLPNAAVTSYTSTFTSNSADAFPTTTTATATVNLTTSQTLSYVTGTAVLRDINGTLIENLPDTVTTTGANIGTVDASETTYLQFEVQVGGCSTPAPVYSCNAINVTQSGNIVDASVNTTASNGATLSSVSYNFGNGSNPVTSSNSSVSYTYPAVTSNTTYTVTATPTFSVNGSSVSASSPNCSKTVSIVAPTTPTTPATPAAKPVVLVNTGPGDVVGLFAIVTICGALAHRLFKISQSTK